jgi:hypothetical protein
MYFAANILLHGKFQMIGSHCNCPALFLSKCGFANCYAFNNVLFGYEIKKKDLWTSKYRMMYRAQFNSSIPMT